VNFPFMDKSIILYLSLPGNIPLLEHPTMVTGKLILAISADYNGIYILSLMHLAPIFDQGTLFYIPLP
jgi:hypothetical protein